ncbi:Zinc finger protein [Halotydeus destructor]|nr:Zinc finger protein [Halotydeus destructor]
MDSSGHSYVNFFPAEAVIHRTPWATSHHGQHSLGQIYSQPSVIQQPAFPSLYSHSGLQAVQQHQQQQAINSNLVPNNPHNSCRVQQSSFSQQARGPSSSSSSSHQQPGRLNHPQPGRVNHQQPGRSNHQQVPQVASRSQGTNTSAPVMANKKNANAAAAPKKKRKMLEPFSKIPYNYVCHTCKSQFDDKASLAVHSPCYYKMKGIPEPLVHSNENKDGHKLTCDVNGCGKVFTNIYMLRKHIGFHFDDYNYQCNTCGHQSKVKSDMAKHVKRHSADRPYRCQTCDKTFRDARSLTVHNRIHTGEKPYKCTWPNCGKAFATSSENSVHRKRVHTHEKNFKCPAPDCAMAYITHKERMSHLKSAHRDYRPTVAQLQQGFKNKRRDQDASSNENGLFSEATQFLVQDVYKKIEREYQCELCHQKFGDKAGLYIHHPCYFTKRGVDAKKAEARKGSYVCEVEGCEKGYDLMYSLRRHMMFHFDEFAFQCNICAHQTKSKSDMNKHVRVHTDLRPYKCQYCRKGFREARALTNHIRTHTGDKPYECTWPSCNKRFTSSSELSVHQKRVHRQEKNFKCPFGLCKEAFVTNKERLDHLKSSHPNYQPSDDDLRQGFKGKAKLPTVALPVYNESDLFKVMM